MLVGESESILRELIFAGECCAEHGGIVAVERDHDAVIEIALYRMLVEIRAKAGAEVAGEADFHGNLALGQLFDQIWIVEGGERVADAFGTKIERSPYGFRRAILAGVSGEAHAVIGSPGVGITKKLGRSFQFVAADADADNFAIMIANGQLEDLLRRFRAELADGVENPDKRDAEVARAAGAAAIEAFEDGGKILFAPEADSNRNVNLGVQNTLFFEALHQTVGDDLVIFRCADVLGDVLKGEQEAREIVVEVQLIDLDLINKVAMAPAKFEKCGGFDCAFEVKMEFRLRQLAEEAAGRPVES